MKKKIYANYGVLAHEKKTLYSVESPASEIYDAEYVNIPDELIIGENEHGQILLMLGKSVYTLNEALSAWGEKPALCWHDGEKTQRVLLTVE